MAGTVFRP